MANYLAIATTTAVLAQKVRTAFDRVDGLSAAPQVFHHRPQKRDSQTVGANIFLYDIAFNTTFRNADLATRRRDGSLIQQPTAALNLKYHIIFYGQESTLETQRMMGAAAIQLHAEPLITPEEIKQYLENVGPESPLSESDLYKQNARIKIEPISPSMEDVTRMWSSFYQQPFEHSLFYEVSVILMENNYDITPRKKTKDVSINIDGGDLTEDIHVKKSEPVI